MNKAFVREPEPDGRAFCPRCGTLGDSVAKATLDHQVHVDARSKMGSSAWFCGYARCEVAYFDLFERIVLVSEMKRAIYPKDTNAPVCPCFGFTLEDIESAIQQRSPASIRELFKKSESAAANCRNLAPNGKCCMQEVQRLYIRGVEATN